MSDFQTIELVIGDDHVATLTLNRPEKKNAINQVMHAELAAAVKQVARSNARVLVLAAEGTAFCSGQDLTEFGLAAASDEFRVDEHVRSTYNKLILAMRDLPMPVIGAIHGVAAGAGASLALATDIRICGRSASFIQAFVRVGLVPDTGSTWFLPHMVGTAKALELAWSGRPVGADEAERIGLVNTVVDDDKVLDTAHEWAQQLAQLPPRAIGMTKKAVYRSVNVTLADALEYEAQVQHVAAATEDHREGVMAFLEKRPPEFAGR